MALYIKDYLKAKRQGGKGKKKRNKLRSAKIHS